MPPAMAAGGENTTKDTRQSQQSDLAKTLLSQRLPATMTPNALANVTNASLPQRLPTTMRSPAQESLANTSKPSPTMVSTSDLTNQYGPPIAYVYATPAPPVPTNSRNLTPLSSADSTAPNSPRLMPIRQNSGDVTPRIRPHPSTLNIPGMTQSKVSPDGMISKRDVNAKLVVIMVGLPARGKSYITNKMVRYLKWQQYVVAIFNVGNRRRVAASNGSGSTPASSPRLQRTRSSVERDQSSNKTQVAHNDEDEHKYEKAKLEKDEDDEKPSGDDAAPMDQSAEFFNPNNRKASALRDAVALSTLDELLDFLLDGDGAVGILDATNSTIDRRMKLFEHIKAREPKLGVLFVESVCEDEKLLEANMRLKLRGPDYKDKDPESSYEDFKRRVAAYAGAYVPLGTYEETHNMQYIKMIDVGRKVINHQLSGFLSTGIAGYLQTFNLSPRQIWITRHGKSEDNELGRLGGNSDLVPAGVAYSEVLYNFVSHKRVEWEVDQRTRVEQEIPVPQRPGDQTPPYPDLLGDLDEKNFCVWTSMLTRSIRTAAYFEEDDNYDVKNWSMLNELNAGKFEGLTYQEIEQKFPDEYLKRAINKLQYIYPGVGGEGYLQVINRLRDIVREIERIKDHVLIIGHRSVARVLMAYFMDLTRDDIADLDVPLGMLFSIEPKPYGLEFHAYKYNESGRWFDELVDYKPQKETEKGN